MLTINCHSSALRASGFEWAMIEVMGGPFRLQEEGAQRLRRFAKNVAILAEKLKRKGLSRMPWPFCDV